MKYIIVAVRDRAADVYGVPHFVASLGAAIRSFGDEINRVDAQNVYSQHPDDFDLYEIGVYDDAYASFTLLQVPKQVAIGKDLKVRS